MASDWLRIALLIAGIALPLCAAYFLLVSFMASPTDYSTDTDYTTRLCGISQPLNAPRPLAQNPYDSDPAPRNQTGYCAVELNKHGLSYALHNVSTEYEALSRGWKLTHKGECGVCSTLRDLAVYLRHRDLTTPVRRCGIFSWIKAYFMQCMDNLGFTPACADIWYYNTRHTAKSCFLVCLLAWATNEPFNKKDGSLNDCLQCDEEKSGPWFKLYAGRTRRNSGIRSEIDRNRTDIYGIAHNYFGFPENKLNQRQILVLLGAPGTGKGSFGKRFSQDLGMPIFSVGEHLRSMMTENVSSPAAKRVRKEMNEGRLVDDDTVVQIVRERLEKDDGAMIILDGFPRTRVQAERLRELGNVKAVIYFFEKEEILIEKLAGRRECPACHETYNVATVHKQGYELPPLLPKKDATRCDKCGTKLVHRVDDQPAAIAERLRTYREQTSPVEDFYRAEDVLHSFEPKRGIAEYPSIRDAVHKIIAA